MREKEILNNLGLVYKAIKNMHFHCNNDDDEEWDEIYIAGVIGLIKGVDNYNKEISKKGTYYHKCITNEIGKVYMLRTAQKRNIKPVSLENYTIGNDLRLEEVIQSNQNIEKDTIRKQETEIILDLLNKYKNKKHIKIVKEYFGIGCEQKSMRELAIKYEISHQRIYYIKSQVLKWIRNELEKFNE